MHANIGHGVATSGRCLQSAASALARDISPDVQRRNGRRTALFLGEGNFSFSLAVARGCPALDVVATGFDAAHTLLSRYPDAKALTEHLRARPNVKAVLHGINATTVDREPRLNALGPFSDVIFTHPHLGFEDGHAHASLLAHFFHAVKAILVAPASPAPPVPTAAGVAAVEGGAAAPQLAPRCGLVHVTLAAEQAALWSLEGMAARQGFALVDRAPRPLEDGLFAGFERKRTLSAKSFAGRAPNSKTFTFAVAPDTSVAMAAAVGGYAGVADAAGGAASWLLPWGPLLAAKPSRAAKAGAGGIAAKAAKPAAAFVVGSQAGGTDTVGGATAGDEAGKQGPEAGPSAAGSTTCPSAADPAAQAVASTTCVVCGKVFRTAQGLRTHAHQVHVLNKYGQEDAKPVTVGAWSEGSEKEPSAQQQQQQQEQDESLAPNDAARAAGQVACAFCGRLFYTSAALRQHTVAKHAGAFTDSRPDRIPEWAASTKRAGAAEKEKGKEKYNAEREATNDIADAAMAAAAVAAAVFSGGDNQGAPLAGVSGDATGATAAAAAAAVLDPSSVGLTSFDTAPLGGAPMPLSGAGPGRCAAGAEHSSAVHEDSKHEDSKHECAVCGLLFGSAPALAKHLSGGVAPVAEPPRVTCPQCGRPFREARALQQHLNTCAAAQTVQAGPEPSMALEVTRL